MHFILDKTFSQNIYVSLNQTILLNGKSLLIIEIAFILAYCDVSEFLYF